MVFFFYLVTTGWIFYEGVSILYGVYGHTYSKSVDQPGKVANSARGQLNSENEYFPSRVSLLIYIARLNLVLTYGIPPEFRGGVHLFILNRHTPSGQSGECCTLRYRIDITRANQKPLLHIARTNHLAHLAVFDIAINLRRP